ncbi:MAG: prepilin-type N-terminal cleavage/methylation domain-containing protein [Betaproteobacteria bacterium]|nr:prepilin-type N-terminal cleavage/methylation domain-containing protein [Betaproteobacteria bacterium]
MRAAGGFTFPELVAVIVIVAVLAAVAVPRFNQGAIDTTWFAEQVKAAVRYAQRQAVAQRRLVYVAVDGPPSAQLRLCYDAACTQPLRNLTNGGTYVLTVPGTVTLSASSTPFWFNGLGEPSSAVTLSVNGIGVSVASETGYVQ